MHFRNIPSTNSGLGFRKEKGGRAISQSLSSLNPAYWLIEGGGKCFLQDRNSAVFANKFRSPPSSRMMGRKEISSFGLLPSFWLGFSSLKSTM